MRLISVCSPRGHTRKIKKQKWQRAHRFYFFEVFALVPSVCAAPFLYSNNYISRCRPLRSRGNINRASLHRWQYPSAWSANWCWMIASWKLKPITRCYTGKGQCDSNLRGRVVPGTRTRSKKLRKNKEARFLWCTKKLKLFFSTKASTCWIPHSTPITPHPMKFY